jgi:anti-sigma B factor antagonist
LLYSTDLLKEVNVASAVVKQRTLDDGTVVFDLHGELDIAVNEALRHILVDTITTKRPPRVVVNMRHVAFVDSTGTTALIAAYNAAQEVGVAYEVREVAQFVEQQLNVAGVFDHLVIRS